MDVPQDDVRADPDGARLRCGVDGSRTRHVERRRSRVPRRRDARDRSDRGSRAALRVRPAAGHVSRRCRRRSRRPTTRIARGSQRARVLLPAGFSESMTFAFIERQAAAAVLRSGRRAVRHRQSASEKFAVLRPSLLPGCSTPCVAQPPPRNGATSGCSRPAAASRADGEGRAAAFAWCGAAAGPHWSDRPPVDFFDAKGVIEALAGASGLAVEFAPSSDRFSYPDAPPKLADRSDRDRRCAADRNDAGSLRSAAACGCRSARLPRRRRDLRRRNRSRPGVGGRCGRRRSGGGAAEVPFDRARYLDAGRRVLPAAAVRGTIRSVAPDTLVSIAEFDRYQGKGVPEGRISLSMRLTFRASDRTLTDDEAQAATERIVEALRAAHDAERR